MKWEIIDRLPVFATIRENGRVLAINRAALAADGRPLEEIIGRDANELVDSATHSWREWDAYCVRRDEPREHTEIVQATGNLWVTESVTIPIGNGRVLWSAKDITCEVQLAATRALAAGPGRTLEDFAALTGSMPIDTVADLLRSSAAAKRLRGSVR